MFFYVEIGVNGSVVHVERPSPHMNLRIIVAEFNSVVP